MDDSDSSDADALDLAVEDGWEDLEDDTEDVVFVSLFDNKTFKDVAEMFEYCKANHDFDIWQVRKTFNLDLVGLIRLVNYLRAEVKSGNTKTDLSSRGFLEDDRFLAPALEGDAVLFSLGDLLDNEEDSATKSEVDKLREELATLQAQFAAYREDVQRALSTTLGGTDDGSGSLLGAANGAGTAKARLHELTHQTDHDYFHSYSYNGIHETMLKDTIRTDAYRDFIYDNKQVFEGKTVLDVGCGTGILSMFCAKAGAKLVIAVDNSEIIKKAKQNIAKNGLSDNIVCLQGKIEEVTLPVPHVDIIVSEWMGYCLLYESMLDSVIYARDHYLKPDGLMVPSHACIRIASIADSEIRMSHIGFWKDVYGFDMTHMLERAHEEALVRSIDEQDLGGDSTAVIMLNLHNATLEDLSFTRDFSLNWVDGKEVLEGFAIWFDMFFAGSRTTAIDPDLTIAKAKEKGILAFSTGPESTHTHWEQGVLLIEHPETRPSTQSVIKGRISYRKQASYSRSLDINVAWSLGSEQDEHVHTWRLD